MRHSHIIREKIPRSYIGSTEDTKHLTNKERQILRAEEKRLAALRKEEIRKKRELEKMESDKLRIEKKIVHKSEQANNPELIARYKRKRNRKRTLSFLKWSGIVLGWIAAIAMIIWVICEFPWIFLAIIILPSWLLAALKDGADV